MNRSELVQNGESSGGEGRTVLSLTVLVIVVSSGVSHALAYAAGCGMLGLTAVAWRRRMPVSSGFGVFFLVDFGLGLVGLGPQQVTLALAFACYGAIVGRVPWLREAGRWHAVQGIVVAIRVDENVGVEQVEQATSPYRALGGRSILPTCAGLMPRILAALVVESAPESTMRREKPSRARPTRYRRTT